MATVKAYLKEIIDRQIAESRTTALTLLTVERIMTALTDLQAAVAAIQAQDTAIQSAVATAIALIQTLHTGVGTVSDADVAAAVAALQAAAGDFSTAASSLGGATPQP